MRSNLARALVVMLVAMFACSLIAVPAYGGTYYEWLERQQQSGNNQTEETRQREDAMAIEDLINALPENAGLAHWQAIERARAAYNGASKDVQKYVSQKCLNKLTKAEARLADESRALLIAMALWAAVYIVQSFLAYGTAYRKAKAGGDSGVSLFGWLLLYNLAALVPFLGFFLWRRHRADSAGAAVVVGVPGSSGPTAATMSSASMVDVSCWNKERRLAEAAKQGAAADVLRVLSLDGEPAVRKNVAENPKTPEDVLVDLSRDKDASVRAGVAGNPRTPEYVLVNLSWDKEPAVRAQVAENPKTPMDVIRHLATDSDEFVRIRGARRIG